MKRLPLVAIATTLALTAFVVPSAAGQSTNVCDLVTKKEASKILGEKVVKIKRATNSATGDQECEYRTNVYVSPRFKKLKAPLKLQVTLGALTAELRGQIDGSQSDLDPISDLGDEAYFSGTTGTDVIVIRGRDALKTEATNWEGSPPRYAAMAEAAARTALPRLPTG